MEKMLVLMRHGKAKQQDKDTERDYDRTLVEQGRKEAKVTAERVQALAAGEPLLIVTSSAPRCVETANILAEVTKSPSPSESRHLYECTASDWLDVMMRIDDAIDCLAFVGHNPTISNLASELAGKHMAMETGQAIILRYPVTTWQQIAGLAIEAELCL